MDSDQEEQYAKSLRLSRVLEDIGINRKMVDLRRQTWLVNETHYSLHSTIFENKKIEYFHFGSQSEGTTTLGMNSDIDRLCCEQIPVLLDSAERQTSPSGYLLVLKNKQSPPQHCNLQLLGDAIPQMLAIWDKLSFQEMVDVNKDGRALLKNTIFYSHMKKKWGDIFIKKGPSITTINKNFDMVNGYHCAQLPMECQFLFNRPRPGHYPRPEILSKASKKGVFLLPQGHAESSYPQLEWRFSTSHMERLLMFDLDINHIKVYTFLKILRKTNFNPDFEDRLSTFHFKTALLFTLETYPSSIWKKKNLLQCVIYCLTTLWRWCRIAYCPHYTISDVNLFLGKLSKFEMDRISSMLSDMIENLPNYVVKIEMDDIGKRILELPVTGIKLSQPQTKPRYSDSRLGIWQICFQTFCAIIVRLFAVIETNETVKGLLEKFASLVTKYTRLMQNDNASFRDAYGFMVKLISSTSASVEISMRIETHQPFSQEIFSQSNLDSDRTSSRLKFASMLYCTGKYEEAAARLDHTEGLLHPDVLQFCPDTRQFKPTDNFLCKALDQPVSEVVRSSVALSVFFLRQELNCVPKHLVYEMYRTFTHADDLHNKKEEHHLTNKANIDSIPFLFYLQYLTYRQLGKHEKKNAAKGKLFLLFLHSQNSNAYVYKETSLHMLGHCMELEGCLDLAWGLYSKSLKAMPNNNAALWHMAIMLNKKVNQ